MAIGESSSTLLLSMIIRARSAENLSDKRDSSFEATIIVIKGAIHTIMNTYYAYICICTQRDYKVDSVNCTKGRVADSTSTRHSDTTVYTL